MSDKRDIQNVKSCMSSGPELKTTALEYYMKTEIVTMLFVMFLSSIHDIETFDEEEEDHWFPIRTQEKSESSISC